MAEFDIFKKVIKSGLPETGDKSQYNYGRILVTDNVRLLGQKRGNITNTAADLYTTVQSVDSKNLTDYSSGILTGLGSEITIDSLTSHGNEEETDQNKYINVQIAVYMYDGDTTIGNNIALASTGDQIRDAIGTGNGFDDTDNRIGYLNVGDQTQDTSLGTYNAVNNEDIKDFTVKNKSTPGIFNTSVTNWKNYLTNTHDGDDENNASHIWIIARHSGDEKEYSPIGHGIGGLSGGYKSDERDREYIKFRIPKNKLYNIFKNKRGETLSFSRTYTDDYGDNSTYRGNLGNYSGHNYRDHYGSGRGHKGLPNYVDPINLFTDIAATITAPTFSPSDSIKSIADGGSNANWVQGPSAMLPGWHCVNSEYSNLERTGLNPKYDMDFVGFPSEFYTAANEDGTSQTPSKYFDNSKIHDFRPITFVSSSFDIDLQGYHDGNSRDHQLLRVLSSTPAIVTFKIKLAETDNYTPAYIDLDTNVDYNTFNYYFFIVNWDWKEGEPETLEQIADQSFPINVAEYQNLLVDGLYSVKDITAGESVTYSDYLEPGVKIIKAVVFSTIDNHWESDDNGTKPYSDYVQAVHWKLVTTKIYLTNEGAQITSDFSDIGGSDFTYLPYPDVVNIPTTQAFFTEENGGIACTDGGDECEDGETICINDICRTYSDWDWLTTGTDEVDSGPGPPSDQKGAYKSSHPVISGISADSTYVNSLTKINNVQPFSTSEIDERNSFERAISLSPHTTAGSMNEWGDYLGQSDISQVRFFNTGSFDMREMLDIETVDANGNFHPHYDIYDKIDNTAGYWNGPENPSFSKESPVGDIFINEYDHFKENCLVELNCGVLDGKTIKDTSGSGNKGILIGDYSIKKTKIGKPTTRDSYIKVPKTGNKDGAF